MRRLGVLLGTVAVVLVLAGCGGSSDDSASTVAGPTPQEVVRTETREAAAAAELERREAQARRSKKRAEAEVAAFEKAEAEEAAEEEREAEQESEADPGTVSKDEFGEEWPLTVASGELECQGSVGVGSVVFIAPDGTRYGLNGTAQDQLGLPPIDPIWRYDPELKEYGLKVNIGPLLNRGLALCE